MAKRTINNTLNSDPPGKSKKNLSIKNNEEIYNFKEFFEFSNDLFSITDKKGRFIKLNHEWENVLGHSINNLEGKAFIEFVHPDDLKRTLSTAKSAKRKKIEFFINRFQHKDGTYRWLKWRLFPIKNLIYSIAKDITYQMEIEEKLKKNVESEIERKLLLEEEHQLFFNTINASPNEIYIFNTNTLLFEYVSAGALKNLGFSLEEMKKKTPLSIKPQFSKAKFLKLVEPLKKGKVDKIVFETVHQRADKSLYNVEVHLQMITQPSKKAFLAVILDITENITYEEKLIETNHQLKLLSDHQEALITAIHDIIMEVDRNKIYTWANKAGYNFFGDDVIGKEASFYFEGEEDVYDSVKPLFNGGENIIYVESWQRRKDGEKRLLAWWCRVLKDINGNVAGAISSAKDITHQRKAEASLIKSEKRFRTLFEAVTEGVALHEVIYDEHRRPIDYRLLEVNTSYEQHTGIKNEISRGKLATEQYGTKEPPYLVEFESVARTGIPYQFETYFPPLKKHFFISVVSPQRGQFATVFEDITDRKRKEEELRQKNEELTRFIYTVSHDLKSPLVTIKAFSSYLEEDIKKHDENLIEKDLGYIRNAADKMGLMLDELLMLSRIGRKDNPKRECYLSSIIKSVLDLVAGQIEEKNIKIITPDEIIILYGDSQRLIQLFQNLIDNSTKFIGNQNKPKIEIGYILKDNEIVLFIKDNGVGIDPRYHKKLFGLFEKLDPESKGSGLGLALVKRIIELHNGKIWVESEGLDKGTTFYFTLENTKLIKNNMEK